MRAPVAPRGCPSATAPPWTFTRSWSISSIRDDHSATAAKASLISMRSRSLVASEARFRAIDTASAGRSWRLASAPPTWPYDTISARTGRPAASAAWRSATTTAAAPSEIWEELAAVIVPSLLKAGERDPSVSTVVSGRIPSSVSTTRGSPLRWGTWTGTISVPMAPRIRCCQGAGVTGSRPLVLFEAADPELGVLAVGGISHSALIKAAPQTVVSHGVDDRTVADALAPASVGEQVGSIAHRLHAPGDDEAGLSEAHRPVGHGDGSHTGQAHLVDRCGGNGHRYACLDRCLAARYLPRPRPGSHVRRALHRPAKAPGPIDPGPRRSRSPP